MSTLSQLHLRGQLSSFSLGTPPGARVAGPPGSHAYLETEHLDPSGGWLSQPTCDSASQQKTRF